jgi:tetratricopeptide (TPR) repeat protein
MLALAAIWKALHNPSRPARWLTAASLAYGLAVGARPNLLFGAVILLVPVMEAWRERRMVWTSLLAATVPIALIGLGLMLYNASRYDSPFEFGLRYQLAADRQLRRQFFSLRHLWFNFRVFFLEPARWCGRFPFVRKIRIPTLPAGHGRADVPFGVLANIPLVWLALAAPLACWRRPAEVRSTVFWSLATIATLFATSALPLGLYYYAASRYEMEFLPALVLLAAIGILSVERALACQPLHRGLWPTVRWGYGLLLAFSVAFNLLASVLLYAQAHDALGMAAQKAGHLQEAIGQYEQALRIKPDFVEDREALARARAVR